MVQHNTIDHTGVTGVGGNVLVDTAWDAAGDVLIGTGANTGAKLTKGAAGTALVAGASTVSWVDIMPWHVVVLPTIWTPDATTGTWAIIQFNDTIAATPFTQSTATNGWIGLYNSSTAQDDAVAWKVPLAAGTWDCHIHARKGSNTGIFTLNQDGASQGTVDSYAASAAYAKLSITGWTVSTTGQHTMQLKMATKNASSSGYLGEITAIEFRRTA